LTKIKIEYIHFNQTHKQLAKKLFKL